MEKTNSFKEKKQKIEKKKKKIKKRKPHFNLKNVILLFQIHNG